jgi:hypothetical protein
MDISLSHEKDTFNAGLWLCWVPLALFFVGLFSEVGIGPCAGPDSYSGCLILMLIGAVGGAAAILATVFVVNGMRKPTTGRIGVAILSILVAAVGGLGGVFLVAFGWTSTI